MYKAIITKRRFLNWQKILLAAITGVCITACNSSIPSEAQNQPGSAEQINPQFSFPMSLSVHDDGQILNYGAEDYYRYGPSIILNDDGSMDLWVSSPGNSNTQWDWIRYRHSEDGETWSNEQIVLKPTPGSKDQCSVCDPAVIYFDGYYYLGYTATDYYAGDGYNNQAFVARSEYPDGPFEKWNGNGWGGDPEPIIRYEDDPNGWGIGELSFVIKDEDLFIYYTYADLSGAYVELCKADLSENWPSTVRFKERVLARENQDSLDAAYSEQLDLFLGFSMDLKMSEGSSLIVYQSKNGKEFVETDSTKTNIEDYAHSVGIVKTAEGHVDVSKPILVGYAYGKKWGRWNFVLKHFDISTNQ